MRPCFSVHGRRYLPFPGRGGEEQEHRDKLKSARQHIEYQNDFGKGREECVVCGRADHIKTGADIVYSRCNRGKVGHALVHCKPCRRVDRGGIGIKGYEEQGYHEYHKVDYQIGVYRPDKLVVEPSAVERELLDLPRDNCAQRVCRR